MKPRLLGRWQMAVLPEDVGARQGRVAAEGDLHCRREPAKREAVGLPYEKRRLGEIHLARDTLHPALVARSRQEADRRGVAREGRVGERVDLSDPEAHGRKV